TLAGFDSVVADLAFATVFVVVTSANLVRRVAQTARAGVVRIAVFPDFDQALRVAPVARLRVSVVASFVVIEAPVATTRLDTLAWIRRFVADLALFAVVVLVADADVLVLVARLASAIRVDFAFFAELQQAILVTTVAGDGVAVVTAFTDINRPIAATEGHANVGIGGRVAHLPQGAVIGVGTRANVGLR